jgi:hypothetical protein
MKKLLTLLFAGVLVFISLFSCSDNTSSDSTETTLTTTTALGQTVETAPDITTYHADYLPDIKYDGYEFRMVAPTTDVNLITAADITEQVGDTVNDAIYERNRTIEEQYDILFKQIDVENYDALQKLFRSSVLAASDDFDLCMLISRDAWAISLEGAVLPVNKLPYIDLTQPWYSHDVNSEITIGGNLYFAYSDECLNMFEQTLAVMFNKQLADDYVTGNLYELVSTGKWTQDLMFTFAKTSVADLDGNGEMTDTDRYGIISQSDMLYPCYWVSAGIKTVGKDSDDYLIFTGQNEKLYTILTNAVNNLFGGEIIYFDVFNDQVPTHENTGGDDLRRVAKVMFSENLSLFYVQHIGMIPSMRGMETDFGIIPFPKYEESQDKYYSRVIDGWVNCVPVTTQDPSRTSVIMEALAIESRNITIPAYFDIALNTKFSRDVESLEMLNIIHTNRTMDIGDTFYMNPIRNAFADVMSKHQANFSSAIDSKLNSFNATLAKANETSMELLGE